MKFRSLMTAICVLAAAQIASAAGPFAYIANSGSTVRTVSVIDTSITPTGDGSNAITATVTLPDGIPPAPLIPYAYGITVGASGQYVYVGLQNTNEVAVIDAATNTIVKRISLQTDKPGGLAVNTAETRLYVAVNNSDTLRVIDISGSGASEVGRVTVSDSSQSVPEGVVLNSTGTKAYVANSADGQDSIAEITLDEITNTYTRSSIIALPAGAKPYGLAIKGTKLYFASFNGTAGVVDTTTKAVTSMTTNTANLSIAVNPVDGKVYAPSNSWDLLYAFDAAGTSLGSPVSAATGPRGVSVTPLTNKLFVAMNLDDVVKVYDTTNLAATPVSIALLTGARPNSFGNFIGPVWDRSILATNGTGCTISPSGTVPVNGNGRTFSITGSGCDVKVNGTSVGAVNSYKVTNVPLTPQTTIDASQITGIYYMVSGNWISSVGGYLVSTPSGINAGVKSVNFLEHANVSLNAPAGFKAINWTDDCVGTADGQPCLFNNLGANKVFGATIIVAPIGGPFFDGSSYYQTWAACTSGAANFATIKLSTDITALTTDGPAYQYTMSNQWNKNDYSQKGTYTPMSLTITSVAVIASDLTL